MVEASLEEGNRSIMIRYAAKIPLAKFKTKLEEAIRSHPRFDGHPNAASNPFSFRQQEAMLTLNTELVEDLYRIEFSSENFNCSGSSSRPDADLSRFLGFHRLRNGLTFLGCECFGDWEFSIFFIIYWDGSLFRAYIPEANHYNKAMKSAYGNNETSDISQGCETGDDPTPPGLLRRLLADVRSNIEIR